MGLSAADAQSSIRVSLGRTTTAAALDAVVKALVRLVPVTRFVD
jgi:cysteine sulfinate desulfinase/cysteine desulfurase-like protein